MNTYIKNINTNLMNEDKKLIIGITIRTLKNFNSQIYCSGIDQNIMFLYNYLSKQPNLKVIFFSGDKESIESPECHNINSLEKLKECNYIISCGISLSPNINKFIYFKKGLNETKLILCLYGNNIISDMPQLLKNSGVMNNYDKIIYDEIWISSHFEFSMDYLKYIFKCNNIHIGPYIWEPDYIPKSIKNSNWEEINIGIFEPNLVYNKSCIIPIVIADKCKELINHCHVFGSKNIYDNNSKFKQFCEFSDLYKENRINFHHRQNFTNVMETKCNIVVSFVENCDLNYLYMECFYLGIPIIHNSKILKDWGYYYEGYDVSSAYEHIKNIKENGFDKQAYIKKHRAILDHYSMINPKYIEFFKSHLGRDEINISFVSDKITHRNYCLNLLNKNKQKKVKKIKMGNIKETILIEFRILPHLEFLIKNTINLLDNSWSHTIVCGNINHDFIKDICRNITDDIRIIKLNYDNLVVSEYNSLLLSINFWNLFYGEKLLIYQEDTIMFHGNIDKYLIYDYVGAPWNKKYYDTHKLDISNGGNGGFSLRTKSKLIECIRKNGFISLTEDLYFSKYLNNVCPNNIAKEFSQETIKSINPVGGHCYWLAN